MLSRRSRELVKTLRKLGELDARRGVVEAEAELARAIEREERARAARTRADAQSTAPPAPLKARAWRLAARAEWSDAVRSDRESAVAAHAESAQELAARGDGLDDARADLAAAMRARDIAERADALAKAERAAGTRPTRRSRQPAAQNKRARKAARPLAPPPRLVVGCAANA